MDIPLHIVIECGRVCRHNSFAQCSFWCGVLTKIHCQWIKRTPIVLIKDRKLPHLNHTVKYANHIHLNTTKLSNQTRRTTSSCGSRFIVFSETKCAYHMWNTFLGLNVTHSITANKITYFSQMIWKINRKTWLSTWLAWIYFFIFKGDPLATVCTNTCILNADSYKFDYFTRVLNAMQCNTK